MATDTGIYLEYWEILGISFKLGLYWDKLLSCFHTGRYWENFNEIMSFLFVFIYTEYKTTKLQKRYNYSSKVTILEFDICGQIFRMLMICNMNEIQELG